MEIKSGSAHAVHYPFVRGKYSEADVDGYDEVDTWNPGVRSEMVAPDDSEAVADGMGQMVLNVISIHKPGHYPVRVFYTRQWETPDGKWFGKAGLHIATLEKFRRLTRGYQYEFRLLEAAQ